MKLGWESPVQDQEEGKEFTGRRLPPLAEGLVTVLGRRHTVSILNTQMGFSLFGGVDEGGPPGLL
jgi:hypothetical protein